MQIRLTFSRFLQLLTLLAAYALLAACATHPSSNPSDPLEPFNRSITRFNDGLDTAVLRPVAVAYREALPSPVRSGVQNFFGNLGDVWSVVNHLMQLRLQDGMEGFMRVSVNTFFGIGGLFDVATEFGIQRHKQDFGQTLGRWGVPAGPYVVLPLFGPSTLRDAAALPIDARANRAGEIRDVPARNSLYTLQVINRRAELLRATDLLDGMALDKYSFTRDAYLQYRKRSIYPERFSSDEEGNDN